MIPKQRSAMNEVTNFRGEVVTEADTDAAAGEAFIALVGDRVRKARERKGITRKTLSELSHVSQRYLAQREGGEGNI
jgi:XRE family aerobic/anaerobic benzoate catabolism transcriptional regulator